MGTINERVAEIRKALGKTQTQFAEALSIKQAALAMIETGKRELSEKNIKLICFSYGVNEKWLRTGNGDMFLPPEDETAAYVEDLLGNEENPLYDIIKAIMKTYNEVGAKEQEIIKEFARSLKENLNEESRD